MVLQMFIHNADGGMWFLNGTKEMCPDQWMEIGIVWTCKSSENLKISGKFH
jgi:hypothetical protein